MRIAIDQRTEELIEERVESGQYSTPEEVIHAALTALDEQEQFGEFEPGEWDSLLADGEKSIDQQGVLDGEAVFKDLRQRSAQRRAERA